MALSTIKAYLIDLFVVCILYGVYLSMYAASMHVLLRPVADNALRTSNTVRRTLITVATLIFLLETSSVVFNLMRCFNHFIDEEPAKISVEAVGIGIAITYLALPLSDAIFLYRCFMVWDQSWAVMVVPFFMWLATVAGCVGEIVNEWIRDGGGTITSKNVNALVDTMGVSGFVLNLTLTSLMMYRIWKAQWNRKVMTRGGVDMVIGGGQPDALGYVQRILIEYGLLWTVTHGVLMGTSLAQSTAAVIASGVAKHMSGIAFSLMILRVSWARSTAIQTASGHVDTRSAASFPMRSPVSPTYQLDMYTPTTIASKHTWNSGHQKEDSV